MGHRLALDRLADLWRFRHKTSLPQQLISLQDQFFIPGPAVVAERDGNAPLPLAPRRHVHRAIGPGAQSAAIGSSTGAVPPR
ncbi:MAG: hypothetical protein WDN25_13065 [Acetobacteraceae bacterium]